MPSTPTSLSSRALEARRLNSLRSTGPRSDAGKRRVSLNALKGGGHLRRLSAGLRDLGENPQEFRRLFADLLASYQPATAAEALLVEDLASLRWNRRRCELALAGLLAHHRFVHRQKALRTAVQRRYRAWTHPAGAVAGGLRGAANAPYKFAELKEMLDLLEAKVEEGNFTDETRALVRTIYGENPTGRGASIARLVDELTRSHGRNLLYEATVQALKVVLLEDDDLVELEESACASEVQGTFLESPDAWLAPDRPEWRQLLRQQAGIDRQIERKTKLLLAMQRERELREARETETVPEEAPPPRLTRRKPVHPELDAPGPVVSTEKAGVPADPQAEGVPVEAGDEATQKDCLFLAKQSGEVTENKGFTLETGVKTKLNSEGEIEPIDSQSHDQAGP